MDDPGPVHDLGPCPAMDGSVPDHMAGAGHGSAGRDHDGATRRLRRSGGRLDICRVGRRLANRRCRARWARGYRHCRIWHSSCMCGQFPLISGHSWARGSAEWAGHGQDWANLPPALPYMAQFLHVFRYIGLSGQKSGRVGLPDEVLWSLAVTAIWPQPEGICRLAQTR